MAVRTQNSANETWNVTKLANGIRVMLAVDPAHASLIADIDGTEERVQALSRIEGYEVATARAIVSIFESGLGNPVEVYVRKATHTFGESYEAQVEYQALLDAQERKTAGADVSSAGPTVPRVAPPKPPTAAPKFSTTSTAPTFTIPAPSGGVF
jgi:hypothetical protein